MLLKKINPISEYHIQILILHFSKKFKGTEAGTKNQTIDRIPNATHDIQVFVSMELHILTSKRTL